MDTAVMDHSCLGRQIDAIALVEEDGYDWGGTMGGEQVHYNRDLLKGNHSRGGTCPWFRHLYIVQAHNLPVFVRLDIVLAMFQV